MNDPSCSSTPVSIDVSTPNSVSAPLISPMIDVHQLLISPYIRDLILRGNCGRYSSRSEADMAVLAALKQLGYRTEFIRSLFDTYPIGEKYREHPHPLEYLERSLEKAQTFLGLSETDLQDPLILSAVIQKSGKSEKLNVSKLEEYAVQKEQLVYRLHDNSIYRYSGYCYQPCPHQELNFLCQEILGNRRHLFTLNNLKEFIHYASGDSGARLAESADSQRYLNLQNGILNLNSLSFQSHSAQIFTTDVVPYPYQPQAECPRFRQFLEEVFNGDSDKMRLLQQAVGYIFHPSVPTPALFFLLGSGNNGKSVFLDVLESLIGPSHCANVNFNKLSDPQYTIALKDKWANVVYEAPSLTLHNCEIIKAAVSGEPVHGKSLYKDLITFRCTAKHFFALNQLPKIPDASEGMWRRLYVIEFNRHFDDTEADPALLSKLQYELSGILNWALSGYNDLISRRFQFSLGPSLRQAQHAWRTDQNDVYLFFQKFYEKKDGHCELFKDVYEDYCKFCQNDDIPLLKKKEYKQSLQSMGCVFTNSTKHNNKMVLNGWHKK